MELLLIRHGLPVRIDDAEGPADPPLSRTEVGTRPSALAGWLAPLGIDALYVSPMRRARETAAPLADASVSTWSSTTSSRSSTPTRPTTSRSRS